MQCTHIYDGTEVMIEPNIIDDLKILLTDFDPKLIVELGTYRGGLTKYLSEWFRKIPIYTMDIVWMLSKRDQDILRDKRNVTIVITSDIFRDNMILPILLSMPFRKFLLCDNGSKTTEVKTYAGYLRPGDLMGVHDWDLEISHDQISHIIESFNPHPINEKFSEPGISTMRLWIKKAYHYEEKIPHIYFQEDEDKTR